MRDKRQKILADPEKYRREQIEDRLPEDFDDMTEEEQMEIEARLEGGVASVDPIALREEIQRLGKLVRNTTVLETPAIPPQTVKLWWGLFENKLFTKPEHKRLTC